MRQNWFVMTQGQCFMTRLHAFCGLGMLEFLKNNEKPLFLATRQIARFRHIGTTQKLKTRAQRLVDPQNYHPNTSMPDI